MSGYAVIGRVAVWGLLAFLLTYALAGLHAFVQLFFFYCPCEFIRDLGF